MSEVGSNNSAMVSTLVNQLKQGKISKGELFAQLSQINRNRILGKTSQHQNNNENQASPTQNSIDSSQKKAPIEAWTKESSSNSVGNTGASEVNHSLPEQKHELQQNDNISQSPPVQNSVSPLSSAQTHTSMQAPQLVRSNSNLSNSSSIASASGFNGQNRRAIIQRLIEEKKKQAEQDLQGTGQKKSLQRIARESGGDNHPRPQFTSQEFSPREEQQMYYNHPSEGYGHHMADDEEYYSDGEPYPQDYQSHGEEILMTQSQHSNQRHHNYQHQGGSHRSHSAERHSHHQDPPGSRSSRRSLSAAPRMLERHLNDPRKSLYEEEMLANYGYYANKDDPGMSHTYNRALRSQEAIRQQLMQQCTFKPTVKELPSFYGELKDRDVPFHDRIQRWAKEKKDAMKDSVHASSKRELEDCTFAPNINQNSLLAAAMITEAKGLQDYSISERLYLDGENHLEIVAHKVGQLKEQIDDKVKENCTFKPDMSLTMNSGVARQTQSRYRTDHMEQSRELSLAVAKAEMEAEVTFRPKTKNPLPHMSAAKEYLKEDVFSRLSKAAESDIPGEFTSDSVKGRMESANTNMGFETFLGSLEGRSVNGNNSVASSQQAALQAKKLEEFNQRQQLFLKKKEEKQNELKIQLTPGFKPEFIAKQSQQHMKINNKGTFLQRFERDQLKKEHNAAKKEGEKKIDPECTFRPTINKKSQDLEGRSSIDMSRGDLLRRETTQRLTKLRMEQQTLQEITFRPQTNPTYSNVPSRLKVASDLGTLSSRIQKQHQHELKRRQEVLAKREDDEVKQYTFKPQIRECPSYIKRMAEGAAKAKAAQPQSNDLKNQKPDWR